MHRYQVDLKRDQWGNPLLPKEIAARAREVFGLTGTCWDIVHNFHPADLQLMYESVDEGLVFLSKFAGLDPTWIEQQDLKRRRQLEQITVEFVKAMAPKSTTPSGDEDAAIMRED